MEGDKELRYLTLKHARKDWVRFTIWMWRLSEVPVWIKHPCPIYGFLSLILFSFSEWLPSWKRLSWTPCFLWCNPFYIGSLPWGSVMLLLFLFVSQDSFLLLLKTSILNRYAECSRQKKINFSICISKYGQKVNLPFTCMLYLNVRFSEMWAHLLFIICQPKAWRLNILIRRTYFLVLWRL